MSATHVKDRFIEIDILRGIAVIMMIIFHLAFDLVFFSVYPVEVGTGFWKYFAIATASAFLFLAGLSLTISASNAENKLTKRDFLLKYLKRGVGILLVAALITLATWWYLGEGYIIFGILHLIGLSIIISPLFLHRGRITLYSGIICIAFGMLLQQIRGPLFLVPLGIYPDSFYSVDYTPVFPWFGLFLLGIFCGEKFYPRGERGYFLPEKPVLAHIFQFPGKILAFLGRNSLLIYILHQPVLILLINPPF